MELVIELVMGLALMIRIAKCLYLSTTYAYRVEDSVVCTTTHWFLDLENVLSMSLPSMSSSIQELGFTLSLDQATGSFARKTPNLLVDDYRAQDLLVLTPDYML
jgi:hypothetical protein